MLNPREVTAVREGDHARAWYQCSRSGDRIEWDRIEFAVREENRTTHSRQFLHKRAAHEVLIDRRLKPVGRSGVARTERALPGKLAL